MSTQTDIFRRRVDAKLGDPPVCLGPDSSVLELVERMEKETASCAIIVDDQWRPAGIITEQDVARRIAYRLDPGTPVRDVMTTPVVAIQVTEYLYHAVAFMRRHDFRHLPVLNDNGAICGMLSLSEALSFLSEETLDLMQDLTHEESREGLRAVKTSQVELAGALFEDNVPVPEVQSLITEINSDIHRRILRENVAALEADSKWGEQPCPFSMIILGSGGRGENFLFPDQDNAFILDDYPDDEHGVIDPWFVELADRMTLALDDVGFPLCKGNVMATNPVWRKTRTQWRDQLQYWMKSRSSTTLRYCDIFFDFAHAFGMQGFADELRTYVTELGARNPGFLKDMFAIQADHTVALGWFNRLQTETDDHGRPGQINLKYRGTLPLVEAVRLMALKHGIAATSTFDRLAGLRQCDAIDDDQHDYLTGGLNHITRLLLRQQLADFNSDEQRVTNFVSKKSLSKREKEYLADCFGAIQDLRGRLSSEFVSEWG